MRESLGLLRNGFNRRESETCFVKEEKRAEVAEGSVIRVSFLRAQRSRCDGFLDRMELWNLISKMLVAKT